MNIPPLPYDVARTIVETSAREDNLFTLSLVCKDFREIADPILYHTVVLDNYDHSELFAQSVRLRSPRDPTFFSRSVKVLFIGGIDLPSNADDVDLDTIVTACSSIHTFSFWRPPARATSNVSIFAHAGCLPYTRLSIAAPIWILIPPHLTHLNMWQTLEPGSRLPESNWRKMFAACPALTHLMFDAMTWPQFPDGITQFGKVVLSMAPKTLKVLVVELLSRDVPVNAVHTDLERMDDERLVVISRNSTFVDQVPNTVYCREAVHASFRGEGRGGTDVWDVAGKVVDSRRARRRADSKHS